MTKANKPAILGRPSINCFCLARTIATSSAVISRCASGLLNEPISVLDYLKRGRSETELIEDRGPVFQILRPSRTSKIFGNHNCVARHRMQAFERANQKTVA